MRENEIARKSRLGHEAYENECMSGVCSVLEHASDKLSKVNPWFAPLKHGFKVMGLIFEEEAFVRKEEAKKIPGRI